jgi:hypothetical protein
MLMMMTTLPLLECWLCNKTLSVVVVVVVVVVTLVTVRVALQNESTYVHLLKTSHQKQSQVEEFIKQPPVR